uniref:GPI transamidase component PIG-T n=1 Tax=Chromera velia CCMP2878 TaxID=1169474 RepID=A0A0G4GKV1_9ALVE|eukprot:Cvel_4849.t1-p1 / transcript=Cvel_4849.t1 / gene=Cvel_4849 / organism=Chromera_velia_CCMP2878 / gene_product=GPI transamidase component PIG-T, putative / transcript_product=GPI transamidase component PIG-T, putative / location=Cvel_scaffold218:100809-108417(+) / protein_length=763 / sequence_SO=supercontig / SO=protein_coding / is_pseudo=false
MFVLVLVSCLFLIFCDSKETARGKGRNTRAKSAPSPDSSLASVDPDSFVEEILLDPLPGGLLYAQFDFVIRGGTDLGLHFDLFPSSVGKIFRHIPVRSFYVKLTQGRWKTRKWGPPVSPVAPPGAVFGAVLKKEHAEEAWVQLAYALSGVVCASLSALADKKEEGSLGCRPQELPPSWLQSDSAPLNLMMWEGEDDWRSEGAAASLQGNNITTQGRGLEEDAVWRHGALPTEAVCTENLTPVLKLLPCRGERGLASLLDPIALARAPFKSVSVEARSAPPPSRAPNGGGSSNPPPALAWLPPQELKVSVSAVLKRPDNTQKTQKGSRRKVSLADLLGRFVRGETERESDGGKLPSSSFSSSSSHRGGLEFRGIRVCPAAHASMASLLVVSSPASSDEKVLLQPSEVFVDPREASRTSPGSAVDGESGREGCGAEARRPSVEGLSSGVLFLRGDALLFEVSGDILDGLGERRNTQRTQGRDKTGDMWGGDQLLVRRDLTHAHRSSQPSASGKFEERGFSERLRGRYLLEVENPSPIVRTIRFADSLPFFLQPLFHTASLSTQSAELLRDPGAVFAELDLKWDAGKVEGEVPTRFFFERAMQPHSRIKFGFDVEKVFLHNRRFDGVPDKGVDLPSAIWMEKPSDDVLWPRHRQSTGSSDGKGADPGDRRDRWSVRFTEGLIVMMPLPDFSMPFNVIALSSTALTLFFGAVFRLTAAKPLSPWFPEPLSSRARTSRSKSQGAFSVLGRLWGAVKGILVHLSGSRRL